MGGVLTRTPEGRLRTRPTFALIVRLYINDRGAMQSGSSWRASLTAVPTGNATSARAAKGASSGRRLAAVTVGGESQRPYASGGTIARHPSWKGRTNSVGSVGQI